MGERHSAVRLQAASVDGADHDVEEAYGGSRGAGTDVREPAPGSGVRSHLRRALILTDAVLLLAAWLLTPAMPWAPEDVPTSWLLVAPAGALLTLAAMHAAGLHRARVCAVRSTEILRIGYACGAVALVGLAIPDDAVRVTVMVASGTALVGLVAGRAVFRDWLLAQRATGRLLRSVAVIGADEEASRLGAHLEEHPELGYEVVGFFRSSEGHATHFARPMLGQVADVPRVVRELGLTGVIVVPGALRPEERDTVLASLVEARVHVHLATGLRGIDSRRLRSLPLGHEPLLYLEPPGMQAPWYPHLKRAIDIVVAAATLIVVAPLLGLAAIAVKLTDRGPVLFRQERVSRGSQTFSLYKLRSMTVDAEERLPGLMDLNEREGGPLFKLHNDPRVTRVGAFLRATSLDEFPQLFNVLRGDMSLVGPRPALPSEVVEFDEVHLVRQTVRPGVTGLWQVEGRDKPSFASYRYLDVFYVENQSLAIDLTVLVATARAVVRSCARAVRGEPGERSEALRTAGTGAPEVVID